MTAITSILLPNECENTFLRLGYKIIKLPPFSALPEPVASHPDMLIFIYRNTLICHRDYYLLAKAEIDAIASLASLSVILSDEQIGTNYPHDILFNALLMKDKLFSFLPHTSRYILDMLEKDGISYVKVAQGYSRCSVCKIGEDAAITADTSLANALRECGVDVLQISAGDIKLDPYDYGFIGGASGLDGDKLFFCGNIEEHPDAKKIVAFCAKHKVHPISLSGKKLCDVGGIMFI